MGLTVVKEKGLWGVHFMVEKFHEDIEPFRGNENEFHRLYRPYDVVEGEGNLLLNEGINNMWNLICGAAATAYNNANARLGVGDDATAAAATQTGLQAATNKLFKAMDATYPMSGTSQKATFRSSFGTSEANFAWAEWSIDNGSGADLNMNRKVESLGTKASGTWVLTVEITLS